MIVSFMDGFKENFYDIIRIADIYNILEYLIRITVNFVALKLSLILNLSVELVDK